MPRGLDHIVHAVRDLDAAAALYRRLGFTVGARNRHPWGTHNHIIQFPGFFIELLTLAEPEKLGDDGISILFGAYNRDFLKAGEGLSLLILESRDAATDAIAFAQAGIGVSAPLRFDREGRQPDGTPVKLGFSLAFVADEAAPLARFATCQHHYPGNFWNPAFQKHANGVTGVTGVVAVAAKPEAHRTFLECVADAPATDTSGGFAIGTWRGRIEVVTPEAFLARFGVAPPDVTGGMRLAALRFAAADASLLQAAPELAGIAGLYSGNAAVIGREDAMGAILVFEPGR